MTLHEQYQALTRAAGIGSVAPRRPLIVRGRDRATFLHGLLSNEVRTLTVGTGCYASWLTAQGRMLTDVHVLETGDSMLLDVPAELAAATLRRLDQSLFSEDVQLEDGGSLLTSLAIHGPAAAAVLEAVFAATAINGWPQYRHQEFAFGEGSVRLVRIDQLGVPGFSLYMHPALEGSLRSALQENGAVPVDAPAITAARVEAGYPVFGIDMTEDTIPLEAGIEDRAISFTKGCYVGQEVIVRVMHRGGGRVARRLMALRFPGEPPPAGTRLFADDRDAGWVTSVAQSPRSGAIGMGYVHRDSAVAGARLHIGSAHAEQMATVTERPIPAA